MERKDRNNKKPCEAINVRSRSRNHKVHKPFPLNNSSRWNLKQTDREIGWNCFEVEWVHANEISRVGFVHDKSLPPLNWLLSCSMFPSLVLCQMK